MITELTEDTVKDFIKEGKVIIDFWMNGCPNCVTYSETFKRIAETKKDYKFGKLFFDREKGESSEFRRTYLKTDKGQKINFPVTVLFENGQVKDRYFGLLDEEQLVKFLDTGKAPDDKEKQLMGIYARKGWLITQVQKYNEELKLIDEQLAKLGQ